MNLKAKILTVIGDIKLQWWPPFIYYQPGPYYRISGQDTYHIMDMLKPGDLILRGYNNYLDGMFIPGKFSHTGIYVGGGNVQHAIAEGVGFQNIYDFCRCDRLAVLRPVSGQQQALTRLQQWVGRPYDFNFKSNNQQFYCHELAAQAYKQLKVIKKVPYLGFLRFYKMTPTYLAESFLENPNFECIFKSQ